MERTKIQITDTYRCFLRILTGTAHAHTVRVKDLLFHLYHLYVYGWGWVEDVSQNIHAYRVRAVRIISFYFILHPPPPFLLQADLVIHDLWLWYSSIVMTVL